MYTRIVRIVISSISLLQASIAYQPITIMTAPLGGTGCGHRQVTESLLRGLAHLEIPFVYNPSRLNQVTEIVIVLADPKALQQAIVLKKKRKIKYLCAGPNIMTRADEHDGILASPEVDICIVPSAWVATAYEEEMPALKGRIRSWFAGVDALYWLCDKAKIADNNVLIYWKTESESFVHEIESIARETGFNPIRLRYGHHTAVQYKAVLEQVSLAIFISLSESQGIALAEAWSMNVPTLVWNSGKLHAHGRIYSAVSASPYLTELTGRMWKSMPELRYLLYRLSDNFFAPRQWVIEHMTDVVSTRMLLDLINQGVNESIF
ncbi:hypothetical protein JST99_00020 [Candidatus Dependentiae bacterium]|nr:hypothetical protein [Candidatus Dependentiae bacterium]